MGLWDEASAQRHQAVNITNHKNTNIIKHTYIVLYYIVFLKYHLVQLMQFIHLISLSLSIIHIYNSSSTYLNSRFYWALQSSCPLGLVTSAWLAPTKIPALPVWNSADICIIYIYMFFLYKHPGTKKLTWSHMCKVTEHLNNIDHDHICTRHSKYIVFMVVSTPPSKHVKPLSSIPPDGSGINPHGAAVFKMLNISSCFTWRRFFFPLGLEEKQWRNVSNTIGF